MGIRIKTGLGKVNDEMLTGWTHGRGRLMGKINGVHKSFRTDRLSCQVHVYVDSIFWCTYVYCSANEDWLLLELFDGYAIPRRDVPILLRDLFLAPCQSGALDVGVGQTTELS